MTNSQYIAALKQERDRAIQYRADKIADLEKTCKSRSNTIIEYYNKIAELAAQVLGGVLLHPCVQLQLHSVIVI